MASLSAPFRRSALVLARRSSGRAFTALALLPLLLGACSSKGNDGEKQEGQTEFTSAPPPGQARSAEESGGMGGATSGDTASPGADPKAPTNAGNAGTNTADRKVEETDLYRVEGDRLYYLNGYRGLLVFDISDVDHPKLLGRSAIFGSPVEMIVREGIATVVVADWFGAMDDGSPFHGSIVRGLDARDPADIKVLGEAKLGGWVLDTRVVGDVLYAVSQDYGWSYGWASGDVASSPAGPGYSQSSVIVSSVSFGGGVVQQKGQERFNGYGGVFHVTGSSILFARPMPGQDGQTWNSTRSQLQYIDISDPGGTIKLRGSIDVAGSVQSWGTDNGRWNLDFADGRTAHLVGCGSSYCGGAQGSLVLATADFTNPDAPKLASQLSIPSTGWSVAARFAGTRLYLSPADGYYSGDGGTTPIQIYDLADPATPKYSGQASVPGTIWNFTPAGGRLFALGSEYTSGGYGSKISLRYLDVTNPASPQVLGTAAFGEGWAWTPAAGTFKAFAKNDADGLVALPFSGWSYQAKGYNNGVQLIEFTDTSIRAAGAAKTKGWVERGVFVKGRVLSLSDQALAVIDYTDHNQPKVVSELVLARNIVDVRPTAGAVAELSTDWWGNDKTTSELRVVPADDVEREAKAALAEVALEGTNARAFRNGSLAYVVTTVTKDVPCSTGAEGGGMTKPGAPDVGGSGTPTCTASTDQVTVVDLANGGAVVRGKVALPEQLSGYSGWGFWGCYWYDWYNGADVVAVGDALAFRRVRYVPDPTRGSRSITTLYVVDLKNADAPRVASTEIVDSDRGWWGSMQAAGNKLYTTHYEWIDTGRNGGFVKYYLDEIDLTNREQPKIGKRINVPGFFVGASPTDPNEIYTIDYRWYDASRGYVQNDFNVLKLDGSVARLVSTTRIDGWVGNVFVRGKKAYTSVQRYSWTNGDTSNVRLVEIDLTTPKAPVIRASAAQKGWGWLLGVEGDRALLTSGWGQQGIDLYRLAPNAAPTFDRFVRTRGWWTSDIARDGNRLYLASGYWGVQAIDLP